MKSLYRFFSKETSSGVILIVAAMFAVVLANLSATQELYHAFLNTSISLRVGVFYTSKNILLFINDILMAIFFMLVGLEIRRETLQGMLSTSQRAALPAVAALGGMITPALIYLSLNYRDPVMRSGWAIPVTTDIAFALSVLALLGKRVPTALKIFLMALAILDDLGSIIIIALFYTKNLSIISLSIAAVAITVLALMNMFNIRRISIYILVGFILWAAVLKSGVHATMAGVIVGFFIPLKEHAGISPARQLERMLYPWVAFIILPLFAFANAGISLQGIKVSSLTTTLLLSIIAGLFIGKPLGISLFCWLAIKLKLASLPTGITFRQIIAVGMLCGIGFTMAIFITSLAFGAMNPQLIIWAKLGILISSLLAAFSGFFLLKTRLSEQT